MRERETHALVVHEPLPTTESEFLAQIQLVEDSLRTKEQSVQEAKEAYDAAKAAEKDERQRRDTLRKGLKELQKALQEARCSP